MILQWLGSFKSTQTLQAASGRPITLRKDPNQALAHSQTCWKISGIFRNKFRNIPEYSGINWPLAGILILEYVTVSVLVGRVVHFFCPATLNLQEVYSNFVSGKSNPVAEPDPWHKNVNCHPPSLPRRRPTRTGDAPRRTVTATTPTRDPL